MSIEAVWNALPRRIRGQGLEKENLEKLNLQEIRLRCGQPLLLKGEKGICFLRQDGVPAES